MRASAQDKAVQALAAQRMQQVEEDLQALP